MKITPKGKPKYGSALALLIVLLLVAGGTLGCQAFRRGFKQGYEAGDSQKTEQAPATESTATETTAPSGAAKPEEPKPPAAQPAKNSQGQTLWLVIAAESRTKAAAEAKRDRLHKLLGAGEDTFEVDFSSHYRGLRLGWWIVVEAAQTRAGAVDEAAFARRGAYVPFVRSATKLCGDPIQVQPK